MVWIFLKALLLKWLKVMDCVVAKVLEVAYEVCYEEDAPYVWEY